jgi:hypothetical protein
MAQQGLRNLPPGAARVAFQQVAELPEATWPVWPGPAAATTGSDRTDGTEPRRSPREPLARGARLLHDAPTIPKSRSLTLRVFADPLARERLAGGQRTLNQAPRAAAVCPAHVGPIGSVGPPQPNGHASALFGGRFH